MVEEECDVHEVDDWSWCRWWKVDVDDVSDADDVDDECEVDDWRRCSWWKWCSWWKGSRKCCRWSEKLNLAAVLWEKTFAGAFAVPYPTYPNINSNTKYI